MRAECTSDAGFVTTSIDLPFFAEATYPIGENEEKAEQISHVINKWKIAMIASDAGLVVMENIFIIFFFVAPPLLCGGIEQLNSTRWRDECVNDVRK